MEEVIVKSVDETIALTPEQEEQFNRAIKRGIYKELHKRNLLTDMQLNYLLGQIINI